MIKFRLDIDDGTATTSERNVATTVAVLSGISGIAGLLVYVLTRIWATSGGQDLGDSWLEIPVWVAASVVVVSMIYLFIALSVRRRLTDVTFEPVASALSVYALTVLAILLVSALLPLRFENGAPRGWLSTLAATIIAVGVIAVTIGMVTAVIRVLITRPHPSTRRILVTLGFLLVVTWLSSAFSNDTADMVSALVLIAGSVLSLMVVRRLTWVVTLTLDKKLRLLWLALCGGFAVIALFSQIGFADDSVAAQSVSSFINGARPVVIALNLYVLMFIVRLLGATIVALPNSRIVDRRSNEVETLSYLTRLIAESATVDELLSSVTRLSQGVCRAHGAWCETYDRDGAHIVATHLVHPSYVTSMLADRQMQRIIMECTSTTRIDDLRQRLPSIVAAHVMCSIIVVPLVRDHQRVGSLVLFTTVPYGFDRDDVRLAAAFGDTVSVALDQARLSDISREQERMHREFEMATRIQASLLPAAAATTADVDVDAVMMPATEVGGDYFDYITFANGNRGVIIADVAGKGVPAALYMATLKGVVLAAARTSLGPADLLKRVNATLFGSMERSTYITIACVEIDTAGQTLTLARAGHTPAIVRTGAEVHTVCPPGMAIGIVGPDRFDGIIVEQAIPVAPGDIFLLTTDGVTERRNGSRTEISIDRITACIGELRPRTAADVVRSVLHLLDDHAEGAEAHDDITIAAIVMPQQPNTEPPPQPQPITS
jgi:serine phosphatase RsbU (regulator of sigma subunit)